MNFFDNLQCIDISLLIDWHSIKNNEDSSFNPIWWLAYNLNAKKLIYKENLVDIGILDIEI